MVSMSLERANLFKRTFTKLMAEWYG